MISKSKQRGTFQMKSHIEKLKLDPTDADAKDMLESHEELRRRITAQEEDVAWQQNNMEYDLRTTQWILDKVRADDVYAQHLYAAMCNVDFVKNETWPVLLDTRWACSWRHAGGIIADMQEKGDYIDWYCSGIRSDAPTADELREMPVADQEKILKIQAFVGEGCVTDEIRADLLTLGWIAKADEYN